MAGSPEVSPTSSRPGPVRRQRPAGAMTPRGRLSRCLKGQPVDRPPVICPGGMMTMATTSAMRAAGASWPEAHRDPRAMADLVLATQQETTLESLAVPFCMTVEAEALGCVVDLGTETVHPHVTAESVVGVAHAEPFASFDPGNSGRAPVVLEALRILARLRTPLPVLGAVVGPVSLAAMVMEAGRFLRLVRRDPEAAERLVQAAEGATLAFALAQRAAGAECITIAEPSATGEVLGGRHFERLALPALTRILGALRERGLSAILHICGDLGPILGPLRRLEVALTGVISAPLPLSVDSVITGRRLREALPGVVRIGNVSPFLLERGPVPAIKEAARAAAREFDVVSPACGVVPTTRAAHLRALVEVVRDERGSQQT